MQRGYVVLMLEDQLLEIPFAEIPIPEIRQYFQIAPIQQVETMPHSQFEAGDKDRVSRKNLSHM